MVWLFPDSPRYAGVAEPAPAPPKSGCSFWNMFGMPQPSYSTSTAEPPPPTPTPSPTTTKVAVDIICPLFPEDTNGRGTKIVDPTQPTGLQKGMPATVAVPPGVTRYRFWFGPATWITPDSLRVVPCWPVATDEPSVGVAPAGALFITPTWVRHHGTGPIAPGSVKTVVFVEFE